MSSATMHTSDGGDIGGDVDGVGSAAVELAAQGSDAWADVVRHQRWAAPHHGDLYALAGELVTTLHAFEDLTEILTKQTAGYAAGRVLYDDTRAMDPAQRLADAVAELQQARIGLGLAAAAVNRFWSAIGHIGVEVTP